MKLNSNIWDLFFAYDEIILHKMGIVIFQMIESMLLKSDFQNGMQMVRDSTNTVDGSSLLKNLQKIKLSKTKMKEKFLKFIL